MKRWIGILLTLCLVLTMAPGLWQTAWGETAGECGDSLTWEMDDGGTLTISGTGEMWSYSPYGSSPREMPWKSLIPDLKKVVIEEGVTSIGEFAFRNCVNLTEVSIAESVERIDGYAFEGCSSVTEMTIPDRVTSLGDFCFNYCSGMKTLRIGSGLEDLDYHHLQNCSALENFFVSKDNAFFSDIDGVMFNKDRTKLRWYPLGRRGSYTIPEGTVIVAMRAFRECKGLTSVTIPDTVTALNAMAFERCTNLAEAVLPDSLVSIGEFCFRESGLTSVDIPDSVKELGSSCFSECPALRKAVVGTGITEMKGCFISCTALKQVFFLGDAPVFGSRDFTGDKLAAYYDDNNSTWYAEGVRQNYGGRICWAGVMANPDVPERMAGQTRTETAVAISRNTFDDGAENVVICSGDNYPDALAGAPLAYMLDAPILLVCRSNPDQATLNEIRRLGARNAYILGGTGVVSDGVADKLKGMGLNVKRIAGRTRFETAVAVAEEMDEITGGKPQAVFFAYANNYPDALSISNVAALAEVPILYIGGSGVLDDATKEYMDSCGSIGGSIILGGPLLIKEKAEEELSPYGMVDRIYGQDRYETCILINATFDDILNGDSVCVACGTNYPDALSGSVFAAYCHAPLLLVGGKNLTDLQQRYAFLKAPVNVFAFGGTYVLPQNLVNQIKQYAL